MRQFRSARSICAAALSVALAGGLAAPAFAQHTPMFTTLPGHATSQVPGLAGAEFISFLRPTRSPDGQKWAMIAATTFGDVLLLDRGNGMGPQVLLVDGDHAPWTAAGSGETVAFTGSDRNLALLNDGRMVFTCNTSGGDSGSDQYIVLYDGVNFTAAAQEGQLAPASAGLPLGTTYGATLESPQIDESGRIGFRASFSGVPTSEDTALMFDGMIVGREGIDAPTGQIADPAEAYRSFTTRAYYRSADGANWIASVQLHGDTAQDRAAVVNGAVVAQEGVALPGFAVPVGGISLFQPISDIQMMPGGDWYVRGTNPDTVAWVLRNGEVVAETYQPIAEGLSEFWDPALHPITFFTSIGNDAGDYLVGGTTSAFPVDLGGVMVLNEEHVVVRSFDPIDLDGNGMDDDDFYINNFLFDDAFFTDDGRLVIVIVTRNALGETFGEAVLDIDLSDLIGGAGCLCERDGNAAQVDVFDLLAYLDLWFANDDGADVDGTPGVDVFDLLSFLDCWFPASAGVPCE